MRPVKNGGRVQNFVYDKNGRLISETDTADNSAISYTYDAFGNENSDNTDDSNSFGYNGEYLDRETGLIYLRARYYDPSIGRFISEDPIKDGSNWYAFCNNNPVTFIDPSGMKPWEYFSTRDKAAKDFGFYIGQKSIDVEEEFASYIFEIEEEDGRVYYFYDVPRNDLESHEERSISFSISWDGTYGTPVAVTHTHGAYDADTENLKEGFSSTGNTASGDDEMSDAYWSDKNNIDYYVITPSGKMSLYVANSGNYSGELISSNMLVDSRIQIYQHMRNTLLWGLLQSNFKKGTAQDYVNARRNNPDSLSDTIKELEKFR